MSKKLFLIWLLIFSGSVIAADITGVVRDEQGQPLADVLVFIEETSISDITDNQGRFELQGISSGTYDVVTFYQGYQTAQKRVNIDGDVQLQFTLQQLEQVLDEVVIDEQKGDFEGISWLGAVSGVGIYEAKKTEVIQIDQLVANKAANVSRQIYARVPGLNIWESDGAGVQLGIGGRGLNPNRTSNFNVRQNGYDISADALGYPESYYTPPVQAIEKIELVRGAATLQYGTQFGGMLNFHFKEGPEDEKVDFRSLQTGGSFGLFNSFNSIGGTIGKVNYYGFYHHKRTDGWRPNSGLKQHTLFGSVKFNFSPLASLKFEQTHMNYLAQQPGGLTDREFLADPRQSKRERNWFNVAWNISALEFDYRFSPKIKINNRLFRLNAYRFAVGNLSRIDRPDDPDTNRDLLKDNFNNWGNEFRAIFHYKIFGKQNVLVVGNRVYTGFTFRRQGDANSNEGPSFDYLTTEGSLDSEFDLPSRNLAFFAENIFDISKKLSITPGIRYENILTEADGYYVDRRIDLAGNVIYEQEIEETRDKRRSFLLGGIGLSYKPVNGAEVYGNFSQNFRAINFNDIRVANPSLQVDENIDDEKGYNADLGVRGQKKDLFRYDLSVFYLSYEDRIGSVLRTEPDPRFNNLVDRTFRFRSNIADAGIIGFESYIEGSIFNLLRMGKREASLKGFLNLAMIRARYTASQENGITGNKVEMVPPVNIKTGLTYTYKSFGGSFLYGYVASHFSDASNTDSNPPVPTAVEGIIPSYDVMDVSFNYNFKNFIFEAGVNNLMNEMYFTRRAAGYPGPGILPSDGRSFYLTVGIDL